MCSCSLNSWGFVQCMLQVESPNRIVWCLDLKCGAPHCWWCCLWLYLCPHMSFLRGRKTLHIHNIKSLYCLTLRQIAMPHCISEPIEVYRNALFCDLSICSKDNSCFPVPWELLLLSYISSSTRVSQSPLQTMPPHSVYIHIQFTRHAYSISIVCIQYYSTVHIHLCTV